MKELLGIGLQYKSATQRCLIEILQPGSKRIITNYYELQQVLLSLPNLPKRIFSFQSMPDIFSIPLLHVQIKILPQVHQPIHLTTQSHESYHCSV